MTNANNSSNSRRNRLIELEDNLTCSAIQDVYEDVQDVISKCNYNTYEAMKCLRSKFEQHSELYGIDPIRQYQHLHLKAARDYAIELYMDYKDSEMVQYFIVNTSLSMSVGKVSAQVAHAATSISSMMTADSLQNSAIYSREIDNWQIWNHGTVVVLGATTEQMAEIVQDYECYSIFDEGRTENTVNALTVIGLAPMPRGEAKKLIGQFPTIADDRVKYRETLTEILMSTIVTDSYPSEKELINEINKLKALAANALA